MPSPTVHLEHFSATQEWLFWSFSRSSALSQREKSTFTKNHSQLSEVSCLWDSKYSCSFSRILTTSVATIVCLLVLGFLKLYQKKKSQFPMPVISISMFLLLFYWFVFQWHAAIFFKLGNYTITNFEIKCLLSSGLGFFFKLPEWTESSKLWFSVSLRHIKLGLKHLWRRNSSNI